jgi:transcription initiation factor TFIID subunit TAF12
MAYEDSDLKFVDQMCCSKRRLQQLVVLLGDVEFEDEEEEAAVYSLAHEALDEFGEMAKAFEARYYKNRGLRIVAG